MKTIKEIDKQIQIENECIAKLYAQINTYQESISNLEKEREIVEKKGQDDYIDEWLYKTFSIKNQREARNGIYIVFDKEANFIKTVTCGYGAEFYYVNPVDEKDTLEYWLKKNKLYAHCASSFCGRSLNWYKMSFKQQLENLGWEFDKNGKLCKTQW